jgi:hypothetical protein
MSNGLLNKCLHRFILIIIIDIFFSCLKERIDGEIIVERESHGLHS